MANNVLFIAHADSGYAVLIAKGYCSGFHDPDVTLSQRMGALFACINEHVTADGGCENNLVLCMEDSTDAPHASSDWCFDNRYSQPNDKGLYRLKLKREAVVK